MMLIRSRSRSAGTIHSLIICSSPVPSADRWESGAVIFFLKKLNIEFPVRQASNSTVFPSLQRERARRDARNDFPATRPGAHTVIILLFVPKYLLPVPDTSNPILPAILRYPLRHLYDFRNNLYKSSSLNINIVESVNAFIF